ncbi:hypothetical protein [Microvirga brassicacearum]|uniref:Uncharacterized protein n=1 Tax=Microvirga brassicacearum TaxID=2580413 RepID=A0A5N3PD73_9HYPH|nr:hypothetical protein [Microvirga brassicacearum]KAB0267654.1 hypothetical protein FEZ63_10240 [Microvirga brassicacearum]
MKRFIIAAGVLAFAGGGVLAQTPVLPPQAPNMPAPKDMPAEKIEPQDPSETGSTLSDKLRRSDGVIRPPVDATPEMTVPAPVPDPGTTPVIPPPGSPGARDRTLDPK